MAKITCTLKEFTYFVDPRVRNNVATLTKKSKAKIGYKCQKCDEKTQLDAAHKHGSSRSEIIKQALESYKKNDGIYEIDDLQQVIDNINNAHLPIEDHFIFLCKSCHREYDSWTKNLNDNEPQENPSQNTPSSKIQETKTHGNSNDSDNNPIEYPCKDETQSWKYKMGWTSIRNRKNIQELISKIDSGFNCYGVARKSWYYHIRKDTGTQFSGIVCNKNSSSIRFRIDPSSFAFQDTKIVNCNRWFFAEGKEKSIDIIPENYDLIMKCLNHAYSASR